MANKKITQLPVYTTPVSGDVLVIVPVATDVTSQISINSLLNAPIPLNSIIASGNAATVPISSKVNNITNNSAATLTITMTTVGAVDGQFSMVRVFDFSGIAQTVTWVNTENSIAIAPTVTNGSITLPITIGFQYNSKTSKWRCVASC